MSMQIIKSGFIADIKKDEALKLKLAQANGCKIATVDRWLRTNDRSLLIVTNLELLKEYFGVLETKELLESRSLVA